MVIQNGLLQAEISVLNWASPYYKGKGAILVVDDLVSTEGLALGADESEGVPEK